MAREQQYSVAANYRGRERTEEMTKQSQFLATLMDPVIYKNPLPLLNACGRRHKYLRTYDK